MFWKAEKECFGKLTYFFKSTTLIAGEPKSMDIFVTFDFHYLGTNSVQLQICRDRRFRLILHFYNV